MILGRTDTVYVCGVLSVWGLSFEQILFRINCNVTVVMWPGIAFVAHWLCDLDGSLTFWLLFSYLEEGTINSCLRAPVGLDQSVLSASKHK